MTPGLKRDPGTYRLELKVHDADVPSAVCTGVGDCLPLLRRRRGSNTDSVKYKPRQLVGWVPRSQAVTGGPFQKA